MLIGLYLVIAIWKVLYPATKEANLVMDCFPDPPTPTSTKLPRGMRMVLEMIRMCRMASVKKVMFNLCPRIDSLNCAWYSFSFPSSTCQLKKQVD